MPNVLVSYAVLFLSSGSNRWRLADEGENRVQLILNHPSKSISCSHLFAARLDRRELKNLHALMLPPLSIQIVKLVQLHIQNQTFMLQLDRGALANAAGEAGQSLLQAPRTPYDRYTPGGPVCPTH